MKQTGIKKKQNKTKKWNNEQNQSSIDEVSKIKKKQLKTTRTHSHTHTHTMS